MSKACEVCFKRAADRDGVCNSCHANAAKPARPSDNEECGLSWVVPVNPGPYDNLPKPKA